MEDRWRVLRQAVEQQALIWVCPSHSSRDHQHLHAAGAADRDLGNSAHDLDPEMRDACGACIRGDVIVRQFDGYLRDAPPGSGQVGRVAHRFKRNLPDPRDRSDRW